LYSDFCRKCQVFLKNSLYPLPRRPSLARINRNRM